MTGWPLGKFMCYFVPYSENLAANASILTLLAIAVERYYVICTPFEAHYICTPRRTLVVCFLVWIFSALVNIPLLMTIIYVPECVHEGEFRYYCAPLIDEQWEKVYETGTTVMFFLLPFFFLSCIYYIIANTLREHNYMMANIRDNESESGSVRTKAKDGSMNLKQRDASLKKRETVKGRNCFSELFHRLDCGCLSRLVHWKTQHEGDQGRQDDSTQERLTDLHIIAEQENPSRDDDVMVAALHSRDADCGSRSAQSPPLKRQDTPSSWKQKSLKDKPAHTIYGNKIQRHHTSTSMTSRSSRNSDAKGSVKRSSMTSPRTASAITRRNHQRVILMLANVVVVFFICWMPYRAFNLWGIYSTAQEHKRLTPQQIVALVTVCRVLVYLNSAINPILYNLISTKFRAAFKSVLPCGSLHGRRRSMSSRSLSSTSSFRFTKKSVDHAC
ncbi:growth hormone secretagogue receptor type 1 [Strongylocentrotus purpuratus]|uniref:G-protein coupled receptors family 1 profile domain-containing protein n=1 Tax=Strongylocentrotus purpuratus TaxID=7668 RepID=A0A7M7RD35_STRPU|nr:growth hormone secretagogue receptor type 1 [Strongylocentrotus purpuratus]